VRVEGSPDSDVVTNCSWYIKLENIARIPRHGTTRIASGPKCIIVCISSQLSGGCRKRLYGPGEGIGHQTPFVANRQIEAMLQSMENDCG
jgi:hypothetical protein